MTEKQNKFCLFYFQDFNVCRAARRAGYNDNYGYSLLQSEEIQQKIKEYKEIMASDIFIDSKDVLDLYIRIAFADINDFIEYGQNEEGKSYVRFKDSNCNDGQIIEEVSCSANGGKIKLCDKFKAIEKLEKFFDLFGNKEKADSIINVITGVDRNEI